MALKAMDQTTTLDKVIQQLMEELRSGRWPVGARIPGEHALAEELAVSRPLVREAIRGLARMGMLEPRRGTGTFVRSNASPSALIDRFTDAEIVEIFEVQMAYDVQAAGMAAERRTDEDLARLAAALDLRNAHEDDRTDPGPFADADAAFHLEVVVAARNPLLEELYRYFLVRLRESLYAVHADLRIPPCGPHSHQAIYDSIAAGDPTWAREAARVVVQGSLNAVRMPR